MFRAHPSAFRARSCQADTLRLPTQLVKVEEVQRLLAASPCWSTESASDCSALPPWPCRCLAGSRRHPQRRARCSETGRAERLIAREVCRALMPRASAQTTQIGLLGPLYREPTSKIESGQNAPPPPPPRPVASPQCTRRPRKGTGSRCSVDACDTRNSIKEFSFSAAANAQLKSTATAVPASGHFHSPRIRLFEV